MRAVLPSYARAPTAALARGLFDAGAGVPEARLDWLLADLGDFLDGTGAKTKGAFLLTLMIIELLLPLVLLGAPRRFSRLSQERRERLLKKMEEGPFALILALPKAMTCLVYYEHPDALAETGYDEPLVLLGRSAKR